MFALNLWVTRFQSFKARRGMAPMSMQETLYNEFENKDVNDDVFLLDQWIGSPSDLINGSNEKQKL